MKETLQLMELLNVQISMVSTVHNVRNMLTTKTWFGISDVCLTVKYLCLSLLLPIVFIASFVSAEDSVVEGASCE